MFQDVRAIDRVECFPVIRQGLQHIVRDNIGLRIQVDVIPIRRITGSATYIEIGLAVRRCFGVHRVGLLQRMKEKFFSSISRFS